MFWSIEFYDVQNFISSFLHLVHMPGGTWDDVISRKVDGTFYKWAWFRILPRGREMSLQNNIRLVSLNVLTCTFAHPINSPGKVMRSALFFFIFS